MRNQVNTPIVKAEQYVNELANGEFFFEVLIWMGLCAIMSILTWMLIKKIFLINKIND